jgi:hypothetical protein
VWTPVASINIVSIPWQAARNSPTVLNSLQALRPDWTGHCQDWKQSMNVFTCFGTIHTELARIHQRWDILSDNKQENQLIIHCR